MGQGVNAGSIYLDLNLNQRGFNSQLNGLTKIASKAGAAIAAAFSIKAVVSLAKDCIELGSDLQEVQNVVDVTFPTMSATIDQFARDAAASFGLSETMAKRYAGTLGSMAEAFGFSEGQAAEMATTLAGLAGDVASFYNLSQDEAYTKLKSVFTGETESLKDLGVVMTQTALDQFALANSFGKTTSAMSEAEKVALRYAFVQEQLSNASGDFSRTSTSWANQIKVLQLRIESIKSSIGQGLINLFTPILVWVNTIIAKLQQAADAFANFTALFRRKDSSSTSSTARDLTDAADSAASAGTSVGSLSSGLSGAASSAKALKRELAGFDKITKLAAVDAGGSSSGGTSGTDTTALIAGTSALAAETADAIDKAYSPLLAKLKDGFEAAFRADTSPLTDNIKRIKESLADVWQSQEVSEAVEAFGEQAMETLGQIIGANASVAASFNVGVSGGITAAIEDLEKFNQVKITSIFDSLTELTDVFGDWQEAVAEIRTAFESPAFQKIVEIITEIFDVISLTVLDTAAGLLKDTMEFFFEPIIQNKDKIKEVLENVYELTALILSPLEDLVDFLTADAKKYEDGVVHQFFEKLTSENTRGTATFLDNLNEALETLIEILSGDFDLGDALASLMPFILGDKVPDDVVVEFKAEIRQSWSSLQTKWQNLTRNIKEKTVEMKARVTQTWSSIKGGWQALTENIKDKTAEMRAVVATKWSDLKSNWFSITDNIVGKVASMKATIATKWSDLKSSWSSITSNIAGKTANMRAAIATKWADLKSTWNTLMENFKDKVCNISLKFSAAASDLKEWINTNVIDKINNKFSQTTLLKNVKIPHLAQGGFVRANTPQLALIGDNRHQGEVVAPENKLAELARKGAELAGGGGRDEEIVFLLKQILELLKTLNLVAYVDAEGLKKMIVKLINDHTRATGQCEIYV